MPRATMARPLNREAQGRELHGIARAISAGGNVAVHANQKLRVEAEMQACERSRTPDPTATRALAYSVALPWTAPRVLATGGAFTRRLWILRSLIWR